VVAPDGSTELQAEQQHMYFNSFFKVTRYSSFITSIFPVLGVDVISRRQLVPRR
jgi:hypothetical protein